MTDQEIYHTIRTDCHDKAFHCFGYSYIFEKRGAFHKKLLNAIQAFGILIPLVIGAWVLSYGKNHAFLDTILYAAIPLSIIQLILSVLAFLYKWDSELSYSYEAKASYDNLYRKFKRLGKTPPSDLINLTKEFDLLDLEMSLRSDQDILHEVSEWEKRRGMKWSLREHKEQCIGCKITPIDMLSKNCYVCGNFSFKYKFYKS